MDSSYREYRPHEALAAFVACYWSRSASGGMDALQAHRVLPDGCVDILFAGAADEGFKGRIIGTMSASLVVPHGRPDCYVAVRFRPGAAGAFLARPLDELTDRDGSLQELELQGGSALQAAITAAATLPGQLAVLERYLLARLAAACPRLDPYVVAAVARLEQRRGACTIDDLSRYCGVSRQHLARRFRTQVGLTPKALARVLRFRAVVAAVEGRCAVDWAALALDLGYYDQAHLIGDFKEFSGLTPTDWRPQS